MKILRPDYMEAFKCIGSPCVDNCCIGWDVDIDEQTFEKYQKIKGNPLETLIKDFIHVNMAEHDCTVNFAVVSLMENKRCPFLDDTKLCKIQSKYGEAYLSNVCAQYPRIYNRINNRLEVSASISCPEIAKSVLFNSKGVQFETAEWADKRQVMISYDVNTKLKAFKGKPAEQLQKIRWICLDIMQDGAFSLEERFEIIGQFVYGLTQARNKDEITNLMNQCRKKNVSKYDLDALSNNMIKRSKQILDILDPKSTIVSERFLHHYKESEKVLKDRDLNLRALKHQYYDSYFENRGYIFENYFVNHMFKSLFPFTEAEWIFHAYLLMLCRYQMMKRQLLGIAIAHKGLTDELILDYFQVFSKAIEHHKTFMLDLTEWFEYMKIDNMKSVKKILL
ncbi:flagellin lysine-N-methylase [Fusibacter ferrireducens]|uniref:Flagellin lysine-N-methylase n=1 Tax=Fusibacter ferrireducens TaxID=2785058 RepID=A0ABR9ZTL2_9FIRM|nr:flagellin lysine-N-methylase [Fusibacter ferrireducens]MBF4693808.1 flagellin lysine-N-methylase [Fusibacter ferrireducens]